MIPVFVVSLARAPERRAAVTGHLQALAIPFRLVDAVDGRALPPEEVARLVAPGRQMHPGAIGCYLSHLEIYRQMLDEDIALALVLEDDARLSPLCASFLREVGPVPGFDYCFLDCDDHNDRGMVCFDRDDTVKLAGRFLAHRLSSGPQTTHCYLITRDAARKRLEHAYPLVKPIDLYDHLPYPIVFRAIVQPKLAWVSEHSLVSFTSQKAGSTQDLSLAWLRRFPAFYALRDLLRMKQWRRQREVRHLVAKGLLPAGPRWAPLPSGREVLR